MIKTLIKGNIPVLYMKEGDTFICYSPALDLVSHGDTFEDAQKSFTTTLKLFIEEVTKMDTWPQVLKEYGWKKTKHGFIPPEIIGQSFQPVEIPAGH